MMKYLKSQFNVKHDADAGSSTVRMSAKASHLGLNPRNVEDRLEVVNERGHLMKFRLDKGSTTAPDEESWNYVARTFGLKGRVWTYIITINND